MHVNEAQQDISARLIKEEFLLPRDDCMEEVRPGTGREAGLGHAGGRAPKVCALGDAWINSRESRKPPALAGGVFTPSAMHIRTTLSDTGCRMA